MRPRNRGQEPNSSPNLFFAGIHILRSSVLDFLWLGRFIRQLWAQVCAAHVDHVRLHFSHHLRHGWQLPHRCHCKALRGIIQCYWRVSVCLSALQPPLQCILESLHAMMLEGCLGAESHSTSKLTHITGEGMHLPCRTVKAMLADTCTNRTLPRALGYLGLAWGMVRLPSTSCNCFSAIKVYGVAHQRKAWASERHLMLARLVVYASIVELLCQQE